MSASFQTEKKDKFTLITTLVDNLNSVVSPELKTLFVSLSSQGEKSFIVDLSKVMYCDSSGLSALLTGNRLSKEANGTFIITGLNPHVQKLIMISQLDNVLNITPTMSEAEDMLYMEEVERELGSDLDIDLDVDEDE